MNIFWLNRDLEQSAKDLCWRHVVKMPTETAQMMSIAIFFANNKTAIPELYIPSKRHWYHPCSIWVRGSLENFELTAEHGLSMCKQYTKLYRKIHASEDQINKALQYKHLFTSSKITPPAQAFGPDGHLYKHPDPIIAYRLYYIFDKSRFAQWKEEIPSWYSAGIKLINDIRKYSEGNNIKKEIAEVTEMLKNESYTKFEC